MLNRKNHLSQLIRESLYEVDSRAVAGAIVARALTRQLVPETEFRNDARVARQQQLAREDVRSFRPSRRVRSFHLSEPASRRR